VLRLETQCRTGGISNVRAGERSVLVNFSFLRTATIAAMYRRLGEYRSIPCSQLSVCWGGHNGLTCATYLGMAKRRTADAIIIGEIGHRLLKSRRGRLTHHFRRSLCDRIFMAFRIRSATLRVPIRSITQAR